MLNQVFLGGSDPLLGTGNINDQLQRLRNYETELMRMQQMSKNSTIWNAIDSEMETLTDAQKQRFFEDEEYRELTLALENMVQIELLNSVKNKIESTEKGKSILEKQLVIVRRLKKKIVQDTDNEIAIFNKFREISKDNPNLTYDEFCKQWHNTSIQ